MEGGLLDLAVTAHRRRFSHQFAWQPGRPPLLGAALAGVPGAGAGSVSCVFLL